MHTACPRHSYKPSTNAEGLLKPLPIFTPADFPETSVTSQGFVKRNYRRALRTASMASASFSSETLAFEANPLAGIPAPLTTDRISKSLIREPKEAITSFLPASLLYISPLTIQTFTPEREYTCRDPSQKCV